MAILSTLRMLTFGTSLVFSLIVLGLCANILSISGPLLVSPQLGLAVSILTLLTLVPMLVIDMTRKGLLTSWVIVELPALSILWVLWLSVGAETDAEDAVVSAFTDGSCDFFGDAQFTTVCNSYKALEAFGFLTWLILLAYTIVLLVFACIAQSRGNRAVWTSAVRDTDFFTKTAGNGEPSVNQYPGVQTPHENAYPPAGQQMYQNAPNPAQAMPQSGRVAYPQA
ncbi:hypothetical protein BD410DRAFT_795478 [Rickenella mellea]|uniref:MARVEL domain-containing protein n=1 Tax=Rickenella mellea TaxID=50990 RepID=A0A4Y7PLT1_9AGAM|nr:hypothetical protein BD410DRAFT_795478 [Rickenella mellea]